MTTLDKIYYVRGLKTKYPGISYDDAMKVAQIDRPDFSAPVAPAPTPAAPSTPKTAADRRAEAEANLPKAAVEVDAGDAGGGPVGPGEATMQAVSEIWRTKKPAQRNEHDLAVLRAFATANNVAFEEVNI
jgi:hypothetical protein